MDCKKGSPLLSDKASVSFPVSLSSTPVDGLLADPAKT